MSGHAFRNAAPWEPGACGPVRSHFTCAAAFILWFGLDRLDGGWAGLKDFVREDVAKYALWHPLSHPDFPWLAICIASPIIGIWYWCTDQYIVQRTLAARNLETARRGTIWGAALKVMPILIFLVPGMIGAALNKQGALHIPTENGELVSDQIFPTLVTGLLPSGLRGLVVAGLLAALMSSLSSLFNSSASLFTIDIYQKIRKEASQRELVRVGKVATAVVVALGLVWIPIIKQVAGGGVYNYLQNVQSFLAPAIAAVFLLGLFWSRVNAAGAVWGLATGFVLGMGKLTVQTIFGTGEGKISDPAFLARIGDFNAYYACGVLFLASAVAIVVASLLSAPPPRENPSGRRDLDRRRRRDDPRRLSLLLVLGLTRTAGGRRAGELVAREAGEGDAGETKRRGAVVDGAEVVAPAAGGELDGHRAVGREDGRDEPARAEHELLHRAREALARELVLHRADDRLAGRGGVARALEDVGREGDVQVREGAAERDALRREVPPRRGRELHHRQERLERRRCPARRGRSRRGRGR